MREEQMHTDLQSRRAFQEIVDKAVQARWKENLARREADQPEPENPMMCDLLFMMNQVIKRVGNAGAEVRKNKGDS